VKPVAVLRPEPGASATVARALELGLPAFALPLFEVRPVSWAAPHPSDYDALLLTSANAVRLAGEGLGRYRSLPVHAVGEATAEAARNAGLEVQATGESGIDALLEQLPDGLRLLHLRGEDYRPPGKPRQPITACTVYRSDSVAVASAQIQRLSGSVALVHSPRAGARLAELVPARASITIAAISEAAVRACGQGWRKVAAAQKPHDSALLSLAQRLCQESQPE
jgi:uroporphyrinogen-III synthase